MEIVFVWINNFRNLKNLQLNLGSEFCYKMKYDNKDSLCTITRTPNKTYIPDFFSPFLNISAIVGENAAGKSSVIEALRQILDGHRRDYIEYLILFKDKDGQLHAKFFLGYDETKKEDDFLPKEKKVKIKSSDFVITNDMGQNYETIFFSQIIDMTIYPLEHDSPLGIDISSNWLSYDDIRNMPEESGYINLAYHKYCESLRQMQFCLDAKTNKYIKTISLPDEIEVHFSALNYNKDYWNTNLSLRGFDDIFYKKIVRKIASESKVGMGYWHFLGDIIRCIYKNFEISGDYLNHDVKIGVTKEKIEAMDIEDAIKLFLVQQDLFDGTPAVKLIEAVENAIISAIDVKDSSFSINISDKTIELIEKYDAFLVSLNKFTPDNSPYGFVSFDWRNMSTGEKAYLNLYSRFYHAKHKIMQRISFESPRIGVEEGKLPDIIYILIDEGEIGFHLQWQKDYVQNLVKNIPQILSFENHKVNYQIIFTTHSPMSLSDIPNDRIIYMCKGEVIEEKMKSFGANISDLITHSFFIHDGLVGSFAIDKINSTIKWLTDDKDKNNSEYHKLIIQNIDEPLIYGKLTEMFINKMGNDKAKEIAKLNILKMKEEYETKYGETLL